MKTKDLVILTFPTGTHAKDEVRISGVYLFAKHVRKHILTPRDPGAAKLGNDEVLAAVSKPDPDDSAQRAWLIEVADDPAVETNGELVEGVHYKITHQTHAFKKKAFDPDTGVYIVAHNQNGVTQVFGYFEMGLPKRLPDVLDVSARYDVAASRGAVGVARLMRMLGINQVRKLCMAACTMASPIYQKGFLTTLIASLADDGLHPLVAGWDIPITVNEDGSKVAAGVHKGPLRDKRKTNKFIYCYRDDTIRFSGAEKKVKPALETKVSEALQDYAKKQLDISALDKRKAFENVLVKKAVVTADAPKGKVDVTVNFSFVNRIRYAESGWSVKK